MKNSLLAVFVFVLSVCAEAQQTAQYSQYIFNHFTVNPAFAGMQECMDIRIGYRQQWVGFEGAPESGYFSINKALGKKRGYVSGKHAIGATFEGDKTGPSSRTSANLAYAYHIKLDDKTTLSAGLFAGVMQYRFNTSALYPAQVGDPALAIADADFVYPIISPGLYLYTEKFFGGITAFQISQNKLEDIGLNNKLTSHYLLMAGQKIQKKTYTIIPATLIKLEPNAKPALDLSLMFDFEEKFAFALSYRNTDAIAGMFKIRLFGKHTLAYSYDFTTSRIQLASSNTHEITIGLLACPEKNVGPTGCAFY